MLSALIWVIIDVTIICLVTTIIVYFLLDAASRHHVKSLFQTTKYICNKHHQNMLIQLIETSNNINKSKAESLLQKWELRDMIGTTLWLTNVLRKSSDETVKQIFTTELNQTRLTKLLEAEHNIYLKSLR